MAERVDGVDDEGAGPVPTAVSGAPGNAQASW